VSQDSGSAKEAILKWWKEALADYPSVPVETITGSFSNGMAFAAAIHKQNPANIDFASMRPVRFLIY
jgi:hypothetical protein